MNGRPACVVDASALLAYLRGEPGAEKVRAALGLGAAISAANWAEVLSKFVDLGQNPDDVPARLIREGILGSALLVWPLDEALCRPIARLRRQTRFAGLSLADRACLALGLTLRLPVLTTDRVWRKLKIGVQVRCIR